MRWHSHNCACAVTCKNVIGNPDRYIFSVDRVEGVKPGKDARLFFSEFCPFEIGFTCNCRFVFFYSFALFRRD